MKHATTYPVLTPDEAKELLRRKGWSNKALALWWGFSEEYISRTINNVDRKRRDDDALRGLPKCPKPLIDN
ncbi:hypothetical protein KDX23_22695 [Burkholderia vietnamiensis]|uniref:hypothetical protein n=1 Tax=Burkholderia vietnamiensis TaxID=60552 RepID=UPI001BA38CF9|nr:hypothetical protein [Burkholderia vietnamiensis]MBR8085547.1 hypothetical protein [Burkholderia vietnamiensis]